MASCSHYCNHHIPILLLFLLHPFTRSLIFASPHSTQTTLLLPITKHSSALQYLARIYPTHHHRPTLLALDLGAPSLFLHCSSDLHTLPSSLRRSPRRSLQCLTAQPYDDFLSRGENGAGSRASVCHVQTKNGFSGVVAAGELVEGALAVDFPRGSLEENRPSIATVPHFLLTCVPQSLLTGLASGVRGTLGLGRSRVSFPSQLAAAFGVRRRFYMCLSATEGAIFAGDEPFPSQSRLTKSLTYTPLSTTTKTTSRPSDYLVNLKSIKVDGKRLPLNTSSPHSIKLSSTIPYATMKSSIYAIFADAFIRAALAMNMAMAPPVAPFEVCFTSRGNDETVFGPRAPAIDLVLQSEMVKWRIYGRNSMVRVSDKVVCLGVLDAREEESESSVVLGGHQLEDVLVDFDMGRSVVGFSPSLLARQTSCSQLRRLNFMADEGDTDHDHASL